VSKPATAAPASSSAQSTSSAPAQDSQAKWEIGDLGFDTEKKLWFIQLYNEVNQNVGTYMAKTVTLKRGNAAQYEWKDAGGRPFWHVRERFFAGDIESIGIDPTGANLTVVFKDDQQGDKDFEELNVDYAYIHYAFHLSNKEIALGNMAPFGFMEFFDITGKMVHVINNHWIIIEGLERKTVGTYPSIRIRIERKDVGRIFTTKTAVIVQGQPK
jgi:hypothetical protein